MKNKPTRFASFRTRSALYGLAAALTVSTAWGVPDKVLNTFDGAANGWGTAWGNATAVYDPNEDNTGNGGGSVYISADYALDQNTMTIFANEPPNGAWYFPGPTFNLSDYQSVEFDIKWDTTKTVSIADFNSVPLGGDGGILLWATDSPDFSIRPQLGTVNVPEAAASGWVHVSFPIDPAISGIDPAVGIVFKKWISGGQLEAGGTYGFWIDNLVLKGSDGPPPPPTVSLTKATPGLGFVSSSGGQYDRQNIVTVGENYSWIGASEPVSYSVDIAQLGDNARPGYEFHFFFVPGTPALDRSDPDWHEPNVIRWDIGNNADGSAYSTFRYKTNAPDDNGVFYSAGQLGGPGSATSSGTWTITFNNDTNVTMTSSDGTILATNIPADVAALFANPLRVYAGTVPGDPSRVGQMAVVNSLSIQGAPSAPNLNSQFIDQPLNYSDWTNNAASATGVQSFSTSVRHWLQWTLPALGFSPQIAGSVTGPWSNPKLSGFDGGGMRRVLVSSTNLPVGNSAFFRLVQRNTAATKLQVLLPGETNDPDSPNGKTGTPLTAAVGVETPFTIHSVDNDWFIRNTSTNMIRLSVTPEDPLGIVDDDAPITSGTASILILFGTPGNYTITATDITDGTLLPGTSATITVTP